MEFIKKIALFMIFTSIALLIYCVIYWFQPDYDRELIVNTLKNVNNNEKNWSHKFAIKYIRGELVQDVIISNIKISNSKKEIFLDRLLTFGNAEIKDLPDKIENVNGLLAIWNNGENISYRIVQAYSDEIIGSLVLDGEKIGDIRKGKLNTKAGAIKYTADIIKSNPKLFEAYKNQTFLIFGYQIKLNENMSGKEIGSTQQIIADINIGFEPNYLLHIYMRGKSSNISFDIPVKTSFIKTNLRPYLVGSLAISTSMENAISVINEIEKLPLHVRTLPLNQAIEIISTSRDQQISLFGVDLPTIFVRPFMALSIFICMLLLLIIGTSSNHGLISTEGYIFKLFPLNKIGFNMFLIAVLIIPIISCIIAIIQAFLIGGSSFLQSICFFSGIIVPFISFFLHKKLNEQKKSFLTRERLSTIIDKSEG